MFWKEWLLDVSHGVEPMPCFVPYEREDDAIVSGMNMMMDRCPGELIGCIHADGQEAVEKWMVANPDWHETFRKLP